MPMYGGVEFKGRGFEFYKYPEADAFPLNKALYEIRNDDRLRAQFLKDMDSVIPRWKLTESQANALKTAVRELKADEVVKEGAHGIMAVTAMLVLQRDKKEIGDATAWKS